eukprot:75615-Rhodomonas_salina.1
MIPRMATWNFFAPGTTTYTSISTGHRKRAPVWYTGRGLVAVDIARFDRKPRLFARVGPSQAPTNPWYQDGPTSQPADSPIQYLLGQSTGV